MGWPRESSPHLLSGPGIASLKRETTPFPESSHFSGGIKLEDADVIPEDWSINGNQSSRPSTSLRRTYDAPLFVDTGVRLE